MLIWLGKQILNQSESPSLADDELVEGVKEVFIQLYKEGLIYKGKRLVNWDPKLKTAVLRSTAVFKKFAGANNPGNFVAFDCGSDVLICAALSPRSDGCVRG